MKTMTVLIMMILTTVTATVSAQNILMASHTYIGKGEGLSIIPEKEIQNEFMVEMKQREGYFKFRGDLFPPAPEDIVEIPVEMTTFEFMGERYLNDPDEYLR